MESTKERYGLLLEYMVKFYSDAAKRFFLKPCCARDGELHSFLRRRFGSNELIYYIPGTAVSCGTDLHEKEFENKQVDVDRENDADQESGKEKNYMINENSLLDYVKKKTGQSDIFLKKSKEREIDGAVYDVVWVFVCGCLKDEDLPMGVDCFFQNLARRFERYLDFPDEVVKKIASEKAEAGKENAAEADPTKTNLAKADSAVSDPAEVDALILDTIVHIQDSLKHSFAPFDSDTVDALSGEYYEKSEHESRIAFLPYALSEKLKNEGLRYPLPNTPFYADKCRELRKFLEMTSDSLWLVLGEDASRKTFRVLGLCDEKSIPRPCLSVRILRHMEWDLFWRSLNKNDSGECDSYIISGRNGKYITNRPLKKSYLKRKLTNFFDGSDSNYESLADTVLKAVKQSHGTMIVILEPDMAQSETDRLCIKKYGFPAEENSKVHGKQDNILTQLTAIDGGILMGTDGKVYAVGVIFDGMAATDGDMSRGARYNSAKKYLKNQSFADGQIRKGMALVVSEDGSIDFLDTLMEL